MKKILITLMMCMTLLMLAACGGGGETKESAPAASDNTEETKESAPAASENPGDVYRVVVKDEAGKPVPGVMVQFCSDSFCQMGETDADGIASYPDTPEGSYTVHIYSVPEGFAEDTTEYTAPETYGDVTVTLKAAE